ncbi:MAG: Ppx/GppA phosphatase family protein [Cetobacterium sp.]
MKKIGIIDIGSNSMRLVIFQITKEKIFYPVEDIKETVRLGEDVNITGKIKEDKVEFGMKTMFLFKEICKKNYVDEIIAFGTAALRISENGYKIVQKIKNDLGIDVEILTGESEALNSFNGAINSMDIEEGVMVDLGGSSLEIVVFKNRLPVYNKSLPFGGVTIGELVNVKDSLNCESENKIRKFIRNEFIKVPDLEEIRGMVLIGVGGTIRNIASIYKEFIGYPLENLHNYKMDVKNVEEVIKKLKNKKYKEKIKTPGLSKSRADLFVGAAIIVEELLAYFNMRELRISSYGIREGILYKRLEKDEKIIHNVFEDSLNDTMIYLEIEKQERECIYMNFIKIYESILPYCSIKFLNNKIIKMVTYFEGIGKKINYYNYEKNSFYMLLNLGLKGVEDKELIFSAFIIIGGRKDKEIQEKYNNFFENGDLEEIKIASKILNLSIFLYEILFIEYEDFHIVIEKKDIIFFIKKKCNIDLMVIEMYISEKRFVNIFGKKIKIQIEN